MKPNKQTNTSTRHPNKWRIVGSSTRSTLQTKSQSIKKNPASTKTNQPKDQRDSLTSSQKLKAQSLKQKTSTKSNLQKQLHDSQINKKQKLTHNSQPVSSSIMFNYLNEEERQKRQNMRAQIQQQRWNRSSQIGTKSGIVKQYEKYFSDAENVFYEDSKLMKELETINWCWKKVLVVFLLNLTFWSLIWSISPYPRACPKHATCGVYINCHQGYVLDDQNQICKVDPQVTYLATVLMTSIIQDMKLEYGQKECNIPKNISQEQLLQHLSPPKVTINQIFNKLNINTKDFELLRSQLKRTFTDINNQKLAKYEIDEFYRIYPLQKAHTITCKMDLFYQNNFTLFIILVFAIIGVIIYSTIQISKSIYIKKGKRIYQYLKTKTIQNKQILFEDYKIKIQQDFNNKKPISQQLWLLINDFRINQKTIGCYQTNGAIIWRSITIL